MCGNSNLVPVVDLGDQCLTGVFPANRDQDITCGPLQLVKCMPVAGAKSCGLVQLKHSYSKPEMYGVNYGYHSSLNSSMVAHLKDIEAFCVDLVKPTAGDVVVDIGSNDGTLLNLYPENLSLIGVDPTITKFGSSYRPHVVKVADFFPSRSLSQQMGNRKARIVTSIAMFYDLDDPLEFVRNVGATLADDGIWVSEQSYLPSMLEKNSYDTICHEHLEYYSLTQLKWAFDRCDLKIVELDFNDTNGGSVRVTAAKRAARYPECTDALDRHLRNESRLGLDTTAPFVALRQKMERHKGELVALLSDVKKRGKLVIGYGASTKGNVILQYCGITERELPFIAEVNEDKFGKFTPRTLIPIIAEKEARAMNPDYFLVLPWHFKDNFVRRESDYLKKGGKLIFPLPEIEVVSA
jgi:hypothetical protein